MISSTIQRHHGRHPLHLIAREAAILRDAERYRLSDVIERTFWYIRDFRSIAMRYGKVARNLSYRRLPHLATTTGPD